MCPAPVQGVEGSSARGLAHEASGWARSRRDLTSLVEATGTGRSLVEAREIGASQLETTLQYRSTPAPWSTQAWRSPSPKAKPCSDWKVAKCLGKLALLESTPRACRPVESR